MYINRASASSAAHNSQQFQFALLPFLFSLEAYIYCFSYPNGEYQAISRNEKIYTASGINKSSSIEWLKLLFQFE